MSPQFSFGTALGTGLAFLGQQIVQDGVDPSIWTQAGIIGTGVVVFLYQERKHNGLRREADADRRAEEDKKDKRIRELEEEVRTLYRRLAGEAHD